MKVNKPPLEEHPYNLPNELAKRWQCSYGTVWTGSHAGQVFQGPIEARATEGHFIKNKMLQVTFPPLTRKNVLAIFPLLLWPRSDKMLPNVNKWEQFVWNPE